jgi:hypothetical protein
MVAHPPPHKLVYPRCQPLRAELLDTLHIVIAGRNIKVASLATGLQHPILQQMAEAHALYQASHQEQGHQGWERRYHELVAAMPDDTDFGECCAESWGREEIAAAATELFNSWRQSSGHWARINGPCDHWGYAMARSSRNVWYGCAITASRRKRSMGRLGTWRRWCQAQRAGTYPVGLQSGKFVKVGGH